MLYFLIFFKNHPQAIGGKQKGGPMPLPRSRVSDSNSTLYMAIPKQSDAKIKRFSVHCSEMPYLLTSFRISS